ncbi:M20/M25/M40 family metallo-hydrolase [Planomicrobium sp. CPCC 101079]|uniref:M20/M25/M40 family metallo-hydrolase n=1 Tax=Planomicrobium sp. CPCC 101079 TaxID=2599618 RepID=UPI0011B38796|nr:M20/M25/M40 family metallo-hydrolase [Planomicrobium sp. CPCC 101079]TWT01598.1 M20/M25/M40 family metallo-hydrolase [Planomicrobium sp. CPCC 101079]
MKTSTLFTIKVEDAYRKISYDPLTKEGMVFLEKDHQQTISEQIVITEIPAPPFKEQKRAEYVLGRLKELGLEDCRMDSEGNVFGIRRGTGNGPKIFVTAHLDTVFPEGTDTTVKEKDGILYAPGIVDDTSGLAELLSVIRAFKETGIKTVGDIIFGGTVGEEGLGDLRGVRAFFNAHDDIDGFISLDGPEISQICYKGTGSFRYKVAYQGPGGHSFGAFGQPSANHALSRAAAGIADIETPDNPKTTFTVGEIHGGTSVNAIAEEAFMYVDLRSNEPEELLKLEKRFLEIVQKSVEDENARWNSDQMTVKLEKIGDRPAGSQPDDAVIVQVTCAATEAMGITPKLSGPGSTDSNVPISLGIPSITLGKGGKTGGTHTLGEWFDPAGSYVGPQRAFLVILGLVGAEAVNEPLLAKRSQSV